MAGSLVDGPAPPLAIRLLGRFEVRLAGQPLPPLRTRKEQWLLALLTLRLGGGLERARLAATLWPDSSESQGLYYLRRSLADLRRALGSQAPRLHAPTPHALALDLTDADVDVLAFDAGVARGGTAERIEVFLPALERAVALYRGPLLEGCAEEWVLPEREARELAYLGALEMLAAAALARGEAGAAERYLRQAVAVDPLRERAQRGLMQALAAGGNSTAAYLVYRELRSLLHRELNAEPDPETTALFQTLRARSRVPTPSSEQRQTVTLTPGGRPTASSSREPNARHPALPEGTVTFLFTDIEGSTRLWQEHPEGMRDALVRHDTLLRQAIEGHGGAVFKTLGDQFCAAFATAPEALAAALAAQRALHAEAWSEAPREARSGPLRVRMALITGTAEEREGDYLGPALSRVARLLEAGHGGQVLLLLPTEELARDHLPGGADLWDLGEHGLKDLARPERVFQLVHPDLPSAFPPLRSQAARSHNLPIPLTSFVGREREMAEVRQRLGAAEAPAGGATRLLTLTGTGGCGKTRLALQVAAEILDEFPDGVWLVELAALADPSLVPHTASLALGVREEPGRPLTATLADTLRAKSLLLVLDNCEHLLVACAQLAESLLRACPNLRIVATSREGLGIVGEQTYRVPSLSVPPLGSRRDGGHPRSGSRPAHSAGGLPGSQLPPLERLREFEAVRLFADRAVLGCPAFAVTRTNAASVVRICQRLEGIPLAIELAAARVKALPVETIAERLDDCFRLLTGGSRTALRRHQTLQGCVRWSYELLSEPERALLRRLSVFAGGWTLEAAERVTECHEVGGRCSRGEIEEWEVLDLLTALVEKSLVQYEERDGEARYRLLETVRQYAGDRLLATGEVDEVRGRHREFFLQLAERAAPELQRAEQSVWLDRLEVEHDNLRSALEWCQTEAGEARLDRAAGSAGGRAPGGAASPRSGWTELRLAGALWWFWVKRGYSSEGRQRVEGALSRGSEAPAPTRVRALHAAGVLTGFQGDYGESARKFFEEALALARAAGDKWGVAFSLFGLGMSDFLAGPDCEQATALAEEALALARETEDKWLIAHPLLNLGNLAELRGDTARATALFDEMLALCREVGDAWLLGIALVHVARMTDYQADHERARALYKEGLALNRRLEDKRGIRWCLKGLADVAAAQQQAERAARLWGAAEALREATNSPLAAFEHASHDRNVTAARAVLGEEAFDTAWAAGRAMLLEQAIAYALQDTGAGTLQQ